VKKVMMILLLVLYGGNAFSGEFFSGNILLKYCEGDDYSSDGLCKGYIAGVADASDGMTWDYRRYCKPGAATILQLKKIVTKSLNNNPDKLHMAGFSLVHLALFKAFPCE